MIKASIISFEDSYYCGEFFYQDGETTTSAETITSPQDTYQSNRDLSRGREVRDATLAKTITKAVTREIAKAHVQYQALLNDRSAAVIPTCLKVTSGANGFKVMDPFDWTKDKAIYQRWQLWSEKARLTLDAMEGDSEKNWHHFAIFTICHRALLGKV